MDFLPREAHSASPLLDCIRDPGVTIAMPQGMDDSDLYKAVSYGSHALELKEKAFVRKEL